MSTRIRIANKEDAANFVAIKNALPMQLSDGTSTTGGFLLGTDISTYEYYIENAFCLVAEVNDNIVGFGIIFNDELLRNSEVWIKRQQAKWNIDLAAFENSRLCYFEQLAFLPGNKRLVIALAYNLVKWVFDQGYETLFTTTVKEPVLNLAAIPFIHAVNGYKVGNIDEVYPEIGRINSDIYLIDPDGFYNKTAAHAIYPFLERNPVLSI
ncbi:MAG: hypothetical protein ACHQFW_02225 [Chitinophagales bacterium]